MIDLRKPCSHGVSMDREARCVGCEIVWWEGVFSDASASAKRAARKLTALRAELLSDGALPRQEVAPAVK